MSDFWDEPEDPAPRLGPIFVAHYETECESCPELIQPYERARANGRGGWIHATPECEKVAQQ